MSTARGIKSSRQAPQAGEDARRPPAQGHLGQGGDQVHHPQVNGAQDKHRQGLGEEELPLPHRAHQGKADGVVGLLGDEQVAGRHHRHQGQEDQQHEGEVGGHQVAQHRLRVHPPRR